jgi:hypothetical protein
MVLPIAAVLGLRGLGLSDTLPWLSSAKLGLRPRPRSVSRPGSPAAAVWAFGFVGGRFAWPATGSSSRAGRGRRRP